MMNIATVNQMETWVDFRKYVIYPCQTLNDSFINLHGKEDEGGAEVADPAEKEWRWDLNLGLWRSMSFCAHNWADGEKADVFGCTAGDWPEIGAGA